MSGKPADAQTPAPATDDADDWRFQHVGAPAWRALKAANEQRKAAAGDPSRIANSEERHR